ncbi:MAG TPA: IMP cyclohydrolase [Clostridia bacterium]|nr:IMP cyclohydrolase [Clostridia bacterium]
MKLDHLTELLHKNPYPGRGIALGLSENGDTAVLLYFIMGRSEFSRNRAFYKADNDLLIRVLHKEKLTDVSLILYTPIRTLHDTVIVTNGDQTDTVFEVLKSGGSFEEALMRRTFEPDAPHFTPRISGLMQFKEGLSYKLSILKSGDGHGGSTFRQFFSYEPQKGMGHFIHTYQGDADPLISFAGEPCAIHIPTDLNAFAEDVWSALHPHNKIAMYMRFYNLATGTYDDRLFNNYASEA